MIIVIPMCEVPGIVKVVYNILILMPTLLISFYLAPQAAKYKCLCVHTTPTTSDLQRGL